MRRCGTGRRCPPRRWRRERGTRGEPARSWARSAARAPAGRPPWMGAPGSRRIRTWPTRPSPARSALQPVMEDGRRGITYVPFALLLRGDYMTVIRLAHLAWQSNPCKHARPGECTTPEDCSPTRYKTSNTSASTCLHTQRAAQLQQQHVSQGLATEPSTMTAAA